MFVDSHCHLDRLDLNSYDGSLPAAIAAAEAEKVSHFLCIGIDLEHMPDVLAAANLANNIFATVGVHPLYQESQTPTVDGLVAMAKAEEKIVAIGETGLDYFYCKGDLSWQRDRFRTHLQAANEVGLPVIVHTRDARTDTLDILKEENAQEFGGVLHCFTEDWNMAKQALDLGFYISISGIVTFRNADELRDVVKKIPMDRLLIETDSPYLAPIPYRGKSNEPKYVVKVAEKIAELKGISVEQLAEQTTNNFFSLFSKAALDQG